MLPFIAGIHHRVDPSELNRRGGLASGRQEREGEEEKGTPLGGRKSARKWLAMGKKPSCRASRGFAQKKRKGGCQPERGKEEKKKFAF